ncbi:MAG: Asp-tRNA(Asn)/Glu-tRNA(Gln) amidotransferase subunit GatA [Armatimonadetes bacterium]|nr:Asp-tRNA(Asn)/Glu-tRNA(Gln) amidotransferase subunit GatA [Armatimonadota bacterium]
MEILTAQRLHKKFINKELSSFEITKFLLERIKKLDSKIKAFISVVEKEALDAAQRADQKISQGEINPLLGMPILIKDNISTKGILTTCASLILQNFIPPYDAEVISRIKNRGMVILGKSNLDEFAMGSSTENSAFGPTHNPWDLTRVPGGSSGGSAAGVAALETILALGSDTGGSIRQPAAFCGVTGLKPTYGLVSRYGLIAFASSLDQIGPIARDAFDCALLLEAIAGWDSKDSTSCNLKIPNYSKIIQEPLEKFKIGIAENLFLEKLDKNIKLAIEDSLSTFKKLGGEIISINLPHIDYALASYYIIAPSEASSNLARYDGARYGYRNKEALEINTMFSKTRSGGFGKEVKRIIMIGTYALRAGYYEAYYLKAQKVRTLIKKDFEDAFRECDLILTPATPTLPFKIKENITDIWAMYLSDIYTVSINLAGLPAIAIPCGFKDNLPIGAQLIGKPFCEDFLLKAAHHFQKNTDFHQKTPEIALG